MLCKSYGELTVVEVHIFVGKLQHLVQTYEGVYNEAKKLIDQAEKDGLFEGINFLPPQVVEDSLNWKIEAQPYGHTITAKTPQAKKTLLDYLKSLKSLFLW